MGIIVNDGDSQPANLSNFFVAKAKAMSVKTGDMVSWNSSGGSASGKVVRVISSGKINVPDSSFSIEGTEDDPAALIQLYRDGKPTDTKVGHKVSTLNKSAVQKHEGGGHDQATHGNWAGTGAGGKKSASDERNARVADSFARGMKALEGKSYKTVMADYDKMESDWRKKTYKPFDAKDGGGGDPQDLAEAQFRAKYGASVLDVVRYAEARNSMPSKPYYPRHADITSNPFTMGSYGESWGN